jgi:hypothetical protein
MPRELNVIAIVAARNEADIVHQTVGDLIQQGVGVYLLDHGSSDGTAEALSPFVGHGLIGIEKFSASAPTSVGVDTFALSAILRRKEQLAGTLKADWFINHDADEFRESPWKHLNLRQGIELVDRLGYNAIDFALLNFWPTHDSFRPGEDVREAFRHYEVGEPFNRVQIRCWKRTGASVDLVASAGHEAVFEGRRVFPTRFLLRHYPIRGQAHGTRKVFEDRVPRFDPAERQLGWHVQYNGLREGQDFIRHAAELVPYDPDAVRVDLHLESINVASRVPGLERQVDDLKRQIAEFDRQAEALQRTLAHLTGELEGERIRARDTADKLAMALVQSSDLDARLAEVRHERDHFQRLIDGLYASTSWTLTAPLRAAWRVLSGRRDRP